MLLSKTNVFKFIKFKFIKLKDSQNSTFIILKLKDSQNIHKIL